MISNLRSLFMIKPDVVFLNHGSFGATPRPVFETYQEWQRLLEYQPVEFISSELPKHFEMARQALGAFLNADKNDLVYIPNATFGVNIVARSLALGKDDEVLATNHEYGACDNVWKFMSKKRGFRYIQQSIPLPAISAENVVEQFWQAVTPKTKVIYISHITSATALCLPIKEICARARDAGMLSVIDGAHAPGQIDLDLQDIDPDFYLGNAHKWLNAPKGSGFIYTRLDRQQLIEPLVVGWGWGGEWRVKYGSDYLDNLQWLGTNDVSAYLSVPAAIDFLAHHNWAAVRQQCHILLSQALQRISSLTKLPTLYRTALNSTIRWPSPHYLPSRM